MKLLRTLALAASTAALLAACGGGDTEDRLDVRDPVVRFIHAVPAGVNLSLYRNDDEDPPQDVAYKSVSKYYDVSNNDAEWSVRAAADESVVLDTVPLDPSQGDRYTFVALPGVGGEAVGLLLIEDPYDKGLTTDKARVRAVHASPLAPDVDVYLLQPSEDLDTAEPVAADVGYGEAMPASGDDSVEIEGGSFRLVLTAAGTKDIVFSGEVSIANNADWLLLAIPGPSGLPNDVRVLVAQGNDDEDGESLELESDD